MELNTESPVLSGFRTIPGIGMRIPQDAYGLYGLGDATDPNNVTFADQLPTWLTQIQTAINTQRLLDLNIDRAAHGLPPITSNMVAPTVNFGLSPDTQQLLMYGGIALLAIFLLKRAKKGNR